MTFPLKYGIVLIKLVHRLQCTSFSIYGGAVVEQKEYEIAYGNTFTRVLSTIFHLIMEALYLFIFNIFAALMIMLINFFIVIIFDNSIIEYVFFILFAALIVFDIADLIMVIFRKPQVILTDSYLYLKRSYFDEFGGIHRHQVILYSEILSCEPTWTSYIRRNRLHNEYYILCFYDRDHEITIKTNKRFLGFNMRYIIPLVNDEEFMDDLTDRMERANYTIE